MNNFGPQRSLARERAPHAWRWIWIIVSGAVLVILLAMFTSREPAQQSASGTAAEAPVKQPSARPVAAAQRHSLSSPATSMGVPAPSPQEVVAGKLTQFMRSRRDALHALARHHKIDVPPEMESVFTLLEAGNWDAIDARYKELKAARETNQISMEMARLWTVMTDAYKAAEQAHLWPPQQLLDYGNAILGSLRPGMVYVGGTDAGRWIPELLNETSEGERHIIIGQNALADGEYLAYLSVLYGDKIKPLTGDDSQSAFKEYVEDARKRVAHDKQFPDQPKQVRAGENIDTTDNRFSVSGMVAVMDINEKLLQTLMEKNPDLTFALQESHPLASTYADALPNGPLMELRTDGQNAFNASYATQSLDYWRAATQQLLSDPAASASPEILKAYAHDTASTANLLAAHNYVAEAEQAYRLASQLAPGSFEAATGLSEVLANMGRAEEGRRVLDEFLRTYPDQKAAVDALRGSTIWNRQR